MKMFKTLAATLRQRRKILLIVAASLFILSILLYLVISLIRVTPAELALSRLEASFKFVPICHEQCSLERSAWEKTVVNDLKRNKKRIVERLKIDWLNKEVGGAFKTELVHILYLAYGSDNPPDYIIEYISDSSAKPKIMREIIIRFNPSVFAPYDLEEILTNKISQATSSAEKLEAIKTLSEIGNDAEINNYFALLDSTAATEIRRETVKDISGIRQKSTFFTKEQLAIIKKIVLAFATDEHLRQDLIFLLSDYYLVYPAESLDIWRAVYEDSTLDSLSRSFSVDNLNHLDSKKVVLPEVSAADWGNYYNQ